MTTKTEYWDQPDDDGVVRRTWRTHGQQCPVCDRQLPPLEDQLLFTGWLLHTAVTCAHGCGTQFEIVNSDPLELRRMAETES